ncbi:alpha/beta hydrolase [Mycobacterium sp. EPG1]|nr:alpha/beta hydrolase [Mycobacterium sp. EPG1]
MSPTVSLARQWNPQALLTLARDCDDAARRLCAHVDDAVGEADRSRDHWTGDAADAARARARELAQQAGAVAERLVTASAAARDGAEQIGSARDTVLDLADTATLEGFAVSEDGSVAAGAGPAPLLVLLSGGSDAVAGDLLRMRAGELTARLTGALHRLDAADADAAADLAGALRGPEPAPPAATVPAGAWPVGSGDVVAGWPAMGQDRIAAQIDAMTDAQRRELISRFPRQVGNTDGVPWPMRVAANRTNIAAAILAESGADEPSARRIEFYRGLLGEVDDPSGGGRISRQILAFDPARASLVELHGDLGAARSVAVLVPGVNTAIERSAANAATARRFVAGSGGQVAMITYLGGPFPQVPDVVSVLEAADPRYAVEMAPRLVAFSEDVARQAPDGALVTVIGHSYGGSIVGTAETLGLTSDRTLFLAAAGAGVGVDDAGDWHNRNPFVERYSMTAPGDFIELVQGIPGGPHGADPDEMADVIPLRAGDYDDGTPVAGWDAHSGMLNRPSDSWRTILSVITGDSVAAAPA